MRFKRVLGRFYHHPSPFRFFVGKVINRMGILSYPARIRLNAEARPQYAYCIYNAALLAKALGHDRMSVIEFGVAGGNGLVNAEYHAMRTEAETNVAIELYGFDMGSGLPEPRDFRDLPYIWRAGFYRMDPGRLAQRLHRARIILGDVAETIGSTFRTGCGIAPLGCVFHDLDFYSSTIASFAVFDLDPTLRLPRIFNYFDDILGDEDRLYNDFTGERGAIADYNGSHELSKIAKCYHFLREAPFPWHSQVFIHHDFAHPEYNKYIGVKDMQNPLHS